MKKIKIGQIGIGHNHGEAKMLAIRKFPELFEIIGFAEENEEWIKKRGNVKGYEGLTFLRYNDSFIEELKNKNGSEYSNKGYKYCQKYLINNVKEEWFNILK